MYAYNEPCLTGYIVAYVCSGPLVAGIGQLIFWTLFRHLTSGFQNYFLSKNPFAMIFVSQDNRQSLKSPPTYATPLARDMLLVYGNLLYIHMPRIAKTCSEKLCQGICKFFKFRTDKKIIFSTIYRKILTLIANYTEELKSAVILELELEISDWFDNNTCYLL